MRIFQITLPYATFGIISHDDKVTDSAPIGSWMIGKTLAEIKPWLLGKGAGVKEIAVSRNSRHTEK